MGERLHHSCFFQLVCVHLVIGCCFCLLSYHSKLKPFNVALWNLIASLLHASLRHLRHLIESHDVVHLIQLCACVIFPFYVCPFTSNAVFLVLFGVVQTHSFIGKTTLKGRQPLVSLSSCDKSLLLASYFESSEWGFANSVADTLCWASLSQGLHGYRMECWFWMIQWGISKVNLLDRISLRTLAHLATFDIVVKHCLDVFFF